MAAASVYVLTTTLGPQQYRVSRAEYEQLVENNLVASLDAVEAAADQVVISATQPTSPALGTVWFNTTIP